MKAFFLSFLKKQGGVLATLAALVLLFSLGSPYFLSPYNMYSIASQATITLVLACGMSFVIATGGIDLSVGSVLGFSGVLAAVLMKSGLPWPLAVLVTLAAGMAVGGLGGFFITRYRIQPFIMTLALLSIVRGLALVVSKGVPIMDMPEGFTALFMGNGTVPMNLVFGALAFGLSLYLASATKFGLYARALGGGEATARICGVDTLRIRISVYAFQGACAALAAFIFMSTIDAAEPLAGLSTEWLEAIAAPIIGGASLAGGILNIPGTLMGALILSVVRSGLNMTGVEPFYQQLAIGFIIIVSVTVDSLRRKRIRDRR